MGNTIITIWLTVTIWTITPNLLLVYKIYTKKIKSFDDLNFIHFFCLLAFIATSVLMTGNIIQGLI